MCTNYKKQKLKTFSYNRGRKNRLTLLIVFVMGSLLFILLSCIYFTNAIEWFGKILHLSQGVVGSILAAVGTAMPETIIPIIAIIIHNGETSSEIGIGAIVGAPFMLGTLGFLITGASTIIYTIFNKRDLSMNVDINGFHRDTSYFIIIYSLAIITSFINNYVSIKGIVATMIVISYAIYVHHTFKSKHATCENVNNLYFSRHFRQKISLKLIIIQIAISIIGITYSAHIFIKYTEQLSALAGIPPVILSLIITPIATELPEKLNSILWIGQKKDTLALGNITGAMVFQSSIPVSIGMFFTPWDLTGLTLLTTVLALLSAYVNLIWVTSRKYVSPFILMIGGILYGIFLIALLG